MTKKLAVPEIYKNLKFKKFSGKYEDIKSGCVLYLNKKCPYVKEGGNNYVLVGDVNQNLGLCDDCTNFGVEDIKEIASLF